MNLKTVTFLKQDPNLAKIIERVGSYEIKNETITLLPWLNQ